MYVSTAQGAPDRSENDRQCYECQRDLGQGSGYRFASAGGQSTLRCLWCAVRSPIVIQRALLTSLVVGTALTAINQGDALLHGQVTASLLWKVPLTYLVPFAVSTYSAVAISRVSR